MTTTEAITHRYITGGIALACANLARMNKISPAVHGAAKQPDDPDYGDLLGAFRLGTLLSLRRLEKGVPERIREFHQHLDGEKKTSAIFGFAMRHGRAYAVRYLQKRCLEVPVEAKVLIEIAGTVQPEQIREPEIKTFIDRLPPLHAEAIRLKYGLMDGEERSFTDLAVILNARGSLYQGRCKWTRNNVGELVREAIEALREMDGINELRRN